MRPLATVALILSIAVSRTAYCQAGTVTLAWDASNDPTVVGYNLYYGRANQAFTDVVSAGQIASATISNLAGPATYHFAATAINVAGLESTFSSEVVYQVGGAELLLINWPANPNPITILQSTDLLSWATLTNVIPPLNSLIIRRVPEPHFYKALSIGADSTNSVPLSIGGS
jgi:hypothetical protein